MFLLKSPPLCDESSIVTRQASEHHARFRSLSRGAKAVLLLLMMGEGSRHRRFEDVVEDV